MKYQYETLGELKKKIDDSGKVEDFKKILAACPDLLSGFRWTLYECAKYAIDKSGCLISYKNAKVGQLISRNSYKKRIFDVGLNIVTGEEIVTLIREMQYFIDAVQEQPTEKNSTTKTKHAECTESKSFDSVIITHTGMDEYMEFDLKQTSVEAAIDTFRDEHHIDYDDVENLHVTFFNKRNTYKVSPKSGYTLS